MSTPERRARPTASQGFTLIELIMFIVIVGVGVAGILLAYTVTVQKSSDPLVRKQLLAVAEALVAEVQLMPLTYCDPDDADAATATSTADCTVVEGLGPEGGETRYSATTPFDNVSDYHGFSMAGIRDITNTPIGGLSGYGASVSLTQGGLGLPAADVLQITVTVTAPGGDLIVLDGYRTRYAPTAVP
ncbi:MAG: prepilin-type N-terminal cleavage/methylation domain-containing protein [Burkholderiales bacterium]